MMKLRTRRALALAGSAVALSIALTGCSTITNLISGDAPRDEETGEVTEESNIDIFSLKVGDCMPGDAMSGAEQSDADVVPCSEPHGYEVYHEFELADGEFPGADAIQAEVEAQCLPAFDSFIGLTFEESALDITWYEPTEDSWTEADDRLVQCLVYDAAGDVEGTLKGAAR
ncbi:septum formation family protein [Microbacterium sp. M28]|uniref:septum formation family protein n=1 Tax=Microbacterium sp. M28 TaxID=2962064 RepID=UPI0021F4A42E|nr:septum formation family protein [Microbacterium sp. M28]UYO95713.1 septum formation family protein [Microbacterium sp. M28]